MKKAKIKLTTFNPCKYLSKIDLNKKTFQLTSFKEEASSIDLDTALKFIDALHDSCQGLPVFEIDKDD